MINYGKQVGSFDPNFMPRKDWAMLLSLHDLIQTEMRQINDEAQFLVWPGKRTILSHLNDLLRMFGFATIDPDFLMTLSLTDTRRFV
jgi:hypothetical protein